MDVLVISIVVILVYLIGYSTGRRIGIKEGYSKGMVSAPILLRKKLYKSFKCPICDRDN